MLSLEFEKFFDKNFFKNYLGVYSADNFPKNLKNSDFFIVNRDPSNLNGSHWMLVFFVEGKIEFFDSLGSDEKTVKNFLKFNNKLECIFNETPVQSINSISCGYFCVYFAYKRIFNLDLSFAYCLNRYFSLDKIKNEKIALEFAESLLS